MSADNYVLVRKENAQWVGYMQCASIEEASYDSQLFCTDTLEDAIILAQEENTEYGYKFEVGGLYDNTS
tara:strand:+ start:7182 stop:7388 length:207 start_codon:yes stop_codon:yes gene_type:complete